MSYPLAAFSALGLALWSNLLPSLPAPQSISLPSHVRSLAQVLTQTLPSDPVAAAAVKIDGTGDGSGVIVGSSGNTYTVLTNWHVVENRQGYTIVTADSQTHRVQQVQRLGDLDIAILTFTSANRYSALSLENPSTVQVQEELTAYGYPSRTLPGFENRPLQTPSFKVTGSIDTIPGGYTIVFQGDPAPGMSGSPLVNAEGQFIGIYGKAPGFYAFGYAIPLQTILQTAQRERVSLSTSASSLSTPMLPRASAIVGNYQWFNGATAQILPNGQLSATHGATGSWRFESENRYILTWYFQGETFIDTLILSSDGSTLSGTNQYGTAILGRRTCTQGRGSSGNDRC